MAKRKNKAAVELAKRRAKSLTKEQRSAIAKKAAEAKWKNVGDSPEARKKAVSAANSARRKSKPQTG